MSDGFQLVLESNNLLGLIGYVSNRVPFFLAVSTYPLTLISRVNLVLSMRHKILIRWRKGLPAILWETRVRQQHKYSPPLGLRVYEELLYRLLGTLLSVSGLTTLLFLLRNRAKNPIIATPAENETIITWTGSVHNQKNSNFFKQPIDTNLINKWSLSVQHN